MFSAQSSQKSTRKESFVMKGSLCLCPHQKYQHLPLTHRINLNPPPPALQHRCPSACFSVPVARSHWGPARTQTCPACFCSRPLYLPFSLPELHSPHPPGTSSSGFLNLFLKSLSRRAAPPPGFASCHAA